MWIATMRATRASPSQRNSVWEAQALRTRQERNFDGGTLATGNPSKYTVDTPDFTLNNPEKEGYTFTGWTGTGITEASTDVKIPQGSTGDREYTATRAEKDRKSVV